MKRSRRDSSESHPSSDSDQEKEDSGTEQDGSSTGLDFHNRKRRRRGVVEKMRRDRINNCLAELKYLVPTAVTQERGGNKLEKAEVLELTVSHLRSLVQKEAFTEMVLPSEYNLLQLCCNLGNVSGTQELHNPRSNLDFMAGFSECARHVSAQLTSMTALHPELQPIQKKLSAHIHQVFKNKFLGLNDFFTQGILFDSSQQDYGSKTGFVKHSTSHLNSDESESVYNVESVTDSLPPMSKSPCTRVKHHKSKGFRPYRSNTSQTKEAAQKDRVNEIQPTHSKPSTQTITRAFDVCSVVGEQSIPRHSRVTSFSEPEQSYSSSSYEDLNAASAAVCPRHLIREEVIRAKSLNTLPRFQEASCAVPDCIRSLTFEEHLGRLSSWQNFNQLSMHKHIVPHHSPQSSKPAWFILPSVYPSCLGHGAQPTFPTTVGSLRPLQMTLSLPSPPSFGSYYS